MIFSQINKSRICLQLLPYEKIIISDKSNLFTETIKLLLEKIQRLLHRR